MTFPIDRMISYIKWNTTALHVIFVVWLNVMSLPTHVMFEHFHRKSFLSSLSNRKPQSPSLFRPNDAHVAVGADSIVQLRAPYIYTSIPTCTWRSNDKGFLGWSVQVLHLINHRLSGLGIMSYILLPSGHIWSCHTY